MAGDAELCIPVVTRELLLSKGTPAGKKAMVTAMSPAIWAVCSEIAHKIKPLGLDRQRSTFNDISYGLPLFCSKMEMSHYLIQCLS